MERTTEEFREELPPVSWREPFEWYQPDEWEQSHDIQKLAYDMVRDGRIEAGLALLANRENAKNKYGWREALHTPPAAEHYRHTYLWDSGFSMMIYSQAATFAEKAAFYLENRLPELITDGAIQGVKALIANLHDLSRRFKRAAVEEGFWLMEGQRSDGFLANVQYADGFLWYEVEKALSLTKPNRTSNYSQPPVLPLAAFSVYKSMERTADPDAKFYLEEMYQSLDKLMRYWHEQRSNSANDKLIGVIDPHETGMDSLRQWDYIKPFRRPRYPEMTQEEADRNMFADGGHFVMRIFERRFKARGDLKKERQLFWANDVAMNGIYLHNLQAMIRICQELGKEQEAKAYYDIASQVEKAIDTKLWQDSPELVPKPGFYSLKADGTPIETITISNLFGLLLPHLSPQKLAAVLNMIDEDFAAPYPLPSDSINSPEFDPHNQEKDRLWRGPTWINTNYYLVEFGLKMQAEREDLPQRLRDRCRELSAWIAAKSNELIDMNKRQDAGLAGSGAHEHYNPLTSEGQRTRVINFAWTWLARFM